MMKQISFGLLLSSVMVIGTSTTLVKYPQIENVPRYEDSIAQLQKKYISLEYSVRESDSLLLSNIKYARQ